MYNVYKVTAANIKKTKNGYELYNLQLNKSLWATKLVPLREIDKRYNHLYQEYSKNNNSLGFLIGRYIATSLENTKFGTNFSHIESFDVLADFKKLLDNSNGKAFYTNIDIFGFLDAMGYPINHDGTITLRAPYSNFSIKSRNGGTVCFPNELQEGTVTLDNIELIYDRFYKGKYIDNGNPDRNEEYSLTAVSIDVDTEVYHKSKTKTLSRSSLTILRVGDRLSDEQCQFLSSHPQFDTHKSSI